MSGLGVGSYISMYKHTCTNIGDNRVNRRCRKCRYERLRKMGVEPKVIVQHLTHSLIVDTSLPKELR